MVIKKKELISEVIRALKDDICSYEECIFDLAEVGLKKWSIKELKDFLGIEE